MTDQNILEKYPNVPQYFVEAITSRYFLSNGGNPDSPIWLCALEEGGGYSTDEPCVPEETFKVKNDSSTLTLHIEPREAKEKVDGYWGEKDGKPNHSNSAIFQVYVMLMTALTVGKLDCDRLNKDIRNELYKLIDKYEFFNKNHYGFLMNAFPVSMPNRADAPKLWTDVPLVSKSKESPLKKISFAEWTHIPSFDEYLDWCSVALSKTFCVLRRTFHPALIYCGGVRDKNRLFRMWSGEDVIAENLAFKVKNRANLSHLHYRWLDNGPETNKTLLIVGPFYSGFPNCITNEPEACEKFGQEIRALLDKEYPNEIWLRKDKFNLEQTGN